ncbi:MAG: hypothetical protein ACOYB2_10650 [Limnohabitans sp.]
MTSTASGSTATSGEAEGAWIGCGCDGCQSIDVEPGDCLILWNSEPWNDGTADVEFQYAAAGVYKVTVNTAGTFIAQYGLAHVVPGGPDDFIVAWCT